MSLENKSLEELNYYEILNVKEDSTLQDIETQYLKLKVLFHPDTRRRGESHLPWFEGTQDIYPVLLQAYSTLTTPELRVEYDLKLINEQANYNRSSCGFNGGDDEYFQCRFCGTDVSIFDETVDEETNQSYVICTGCDYIYSLDSNI